MRARTTIISNSVSATLAITVDLVFSLILLPLIVTALGKQDYGIWILIGQSMGFLILSDLGTASAMGRFIAQARGAKNKGQIDAVVSTGLILLVFVAAFVAFLTLVLRHSVPVWLGVDPGGLELAQAVFVITGLGLAVVIPLRVADSVLRGYQKYAAINVARVLYTILRASIVFLLLAFNQLSLLSLAGGFALASVCYYLSLALFAFRVNNGVKFTITNFKNVSRALFDMGLASIFITTSANIYRDGILIAVGPLLGPAAVSVYGIALTLITRLSDLLSQIGNPMLTLASETSSQGANGKIRSISDGVMRVTFALGTSAAAGIAVYSEPVLRLWLGRSDWTASDYRVAALSMTLMGVALAIGLPQLAARSLLQGVGKHWLVARRFFIASSSGLLLAIILMNYNWGILGAAAGWSLVMILQGLVIYPPALLRYLHQSLNEMVLRVYLPGFLVGLGVFLTAYMAAFFLPPHNILNLLIGILLGLLASVLGLVIISQSIRNWIFVFFTKKVKKG